MGSTRSIVTSRHSASSETSHSSVSAESEIGTGESVASAASSEAREAARTAALDFGLGEPLREALPVVGRSADLGLDFAALATARAAFMRVELVPVSGQADCDTISAPELSASALAELFQHYQTLYGLHDPESEFGPMPPASHLEILRGFAEAIRAGIPAAPDVRFRLEAYRLLSAIYAELAARGGNFQDRNVLGSLVATWLEELQDYPIAAETIWQDTATILGFARDHVLSDAGRDALHSALNAQVEAALAPRAEGEELRAAIARHNHGDALVRAANEAIGHPYDDRIPDAQNALVVDALALEDEVAAQAGMARIAVLGELAAIYRRLGEDEFSGEFYRGRLAAALDQILALCSDESFDLSQRIAVRLELAQQFESLGNAARAAELRHALLLEGQSAQAEARGAPDLAGRLESLTEAFLIFQSLNRAEDAAAMSAQILPLLNRVLRTAEDTADVEAQRQLRAYAIEGFLLIGEVDAAQSAVERMAESFPETVEPERVDAQAQTLLRLMGYAQQIATARADRTEAAADFSQFRSLLQRLAAMGAAHGRRTMELYAQFMGALLDNDIAAEGLYQALQAWRPEGFHEMEAVNAGAPAFLHVELAEYAADEFQEMSAQLWETQRLPFIAQRSGPTIHLLSTLIEEAYQQRIAYLESEDRSTGVTRDIRDMMRRYLSHVQAALASGRASTTREAIAQLTESTGDTNASERFMIELGMAFDSDLGVNHRSLVNQILDFEEIGVSELRAERMLSLARTLIVSDSLDQRFGNLIDALLGGAQADLDDPNLRPEMESVLRLRFPRAEPHELWELYDSLVGNESLSDRVASSRNVAPYVQGFNQIVDQVFSVEGGVIMLASIFTGGIAAELAGAAALARMGTTAYTLVNGAARLTWAARATLWGVRVGAGFVARSAVELGGTAAWRLASGRRQMNLEEVRQRLIVSLFSSIGDEVATRVTHMLVPGLLHRLLGTGARATLATHATTEVAEFFSTGLGEMWGEELGGRISGGPLDDRPFLVRYFQECVHGAFFMAGHRVGRPVSEAILHSAHEMSRSPLSDPAEPAAPILSAPPRRSPPPNSERPRLERRRTPSRRREPRLETPGPRIRPHPEVHPARPPRSRALERSHWRSRRGLEINAADLGEFNPGLASFIRSRWGEDAQPLGSELALTPARPRETLHGNTGGLRLSDDSRDSETRSPSRTREQATQELHTLLEEWSAYRSNVSPRDAFGITREPYLRFLRRAANLLRPAPGRSPLSLAEIDALESAFAETSPLDRGGDRSVVYGFDPRSGAGVFQAISREQVTALAQYIRATGARTVVEVGAGDGRLAAALRTELARDPVTVRATDNASWEILAQDVERMDAEAAARQADVILASWVPKETEPAQAYDYRVARLLQENPGKTFIVLMASSQTGSVPFFHHVLGETHPESEVVVVGENAAEARLFRSLPVRVEEPLSLNAVRAPDGLLYRIGRSRRKFGGVREGSYVLALRSSEASLGPALSPLTLTDYIPPEATQVSETIFHHEVSIVSLPSSSDGDGGSRSDSESQDDAEEVFGLVDASEESAVNGPERKVPARTTVYGISHNGSDVERVYVENLLRRARARGVTRVGLELSRDLLENPHFGNVFKNYARIAESLGMETICLESEANRRRRGTLSMAKLYLGDDGTFQQERLANEIHRLEIATQDLKRKTHRVSPELAEQMLLAWLAQENQLRNLRQLHDNLEILDWDIDRWVEAWNQANVDLANQEMLDTITHEAPGIVLVGLAHANAFPRDPELQVLPAALDYDEFLHGLRPLGDGSLEAGALARSPGADLLVQPFLAEMLRPLLADPAVNTLQDILFYAYGAEPDLTPLALRAFGSRDPQSFLGLLDPSVDAVFLKMTAAQARSRIEAAFRTAMPYVFVDGQAPARHPAHPYVPFLSQWTEAAWNYSGRDRRFIAASAELARRFEAQQISVDTLVLELRSLIRVSFPDSSARLFVELALSLAQHGLIEPVQRLLREEHLPSVMRRQSSELPQLWHAHEDEVHLALVRAMVRQEIFEGEINPLDHVERIRDRETRFRAWQELFDGLVAADGLEAPRAVALIENAARTIPHEDVLRLLVQLEAARQQLREGRGRPGGIVASVLLAFSAGTATLLDSSTASASVHPVLPPELADILLQQHDTIIGLAVALGLGWSGAVLYRALTVSRRAQRLIHQITEALANEGPYRNWERFDIDSRRTLGILARLREIFSDRSLSYGDRIDALHAYLQVMKPKDIDPEVLVEEAVSFREILPNMMDPEQVWKNAPRFLFNPGNSYLTFWDSLTLTYRKLLSRLPPGHSEWRHALDQLYRLHAIHPNHRGILGLIRNIHRLDPPSNPSEDTTVLAARGPAIPEAPTVEKSEASPQAEPESSASIPETRFEVNEDDANDDIPDRKEPEVRRQRRIDNKGGGGPGGTLTALLAASAGAATLLGAEVAHAQERLPSSDAGSWDSVVSWVLFGGALASGLYYVWINSAEARSRQLNRMIAELRSASTSTERREASEHLARRIRSEPEAVNLEGLRSLYEQIREGRLEALDIYLSLLEAEHQGARQFLTAERVKVCEALVLLQAREPKGMERLLRSTLDARISAALIDSVARRLNHPLVMRTLMSYLVLGNLRSQLILLKALEEARPEQLETLQDMLRTLRRARRNAHAARLLDKIRRRPDLALWLQMESGASEESGSPGGGAVAALLAAGSGAATLLVPELTHASVTLAGTAGAWPAWMWGIGVGLGAVALGSVIGKRTPPSTQLSFGTEPRRQIFEIYLRKLMAEGMSREQLSLLGALERSALMSLPELGQATRHSVAVGQVFPNIRELEAAGLVSAVELRHPAYGLTTRGRRIFALFNSFDISLLLPTTGRAVIHYLESGHWVTEKSVVESISPRFPGQDVVRELAVLVDRDLLERRKHPSRYKVLEYRLTDFGNELLLRDQQRNRALEKILSEG